MDFSWPSNGFIRDYIDVDFACWLLWLFTPLLIVFLFPLVLVILIYISGLIIFIYRRRHQLALDELIDDLEHRRYWEGAIHAVAIMWEAHGYLWHGYEVEGLENIPDDKPVLLVYYHGALPIDYYYLLAKYFLLKRRLFRSVGDRFLLKIPGWSFLCSVLKVFPGSVSTCVQVLNEGHHLGISPGGVREAQFGNHSYNLVWAGRVGFAKVAKQAKVPIVPVFTRNVREAFRTLQIFPNFFRAIYDKYKIPLMFTYGGFPVKLKTIIGEPIYFDPDLSPEEIAELTAKKLEELIEKHQKPRPGSILKALAQRWCCD